MKDNYHNLHIKVRCSRLQVVHCAGTLINTLLDAGAQNYLEFKLLQQRYIFLYLESHQDNISPEIHNLPQISVPSGSWQI